MVSSVRFLLDKPLAGAKLGSFLVETPATVAKRVGGFCISASPKNLGLNLRLPRSAVKSLFFLVFGFPLHDLRLM